MEPSTAAKLVTLDSNSISDALVNLQSKIDRLKTRHDFAVEAVTQERRQLKKAKQQLKAVTEAQQLAQGVAQIVQQQAHQRIAGVVTRCLSSVFGEDAYEFQIQFDRKRGKTEACLIFLRDGQERHPLRSSGGGVVDCASFALRLSCMLLSKPQTRKLLVLDEPWKHLSEEYRPLIRQMVETLAQEMGVQIILVTHSEDFKIGKVIEIGD